MNFGSDTETRTGYVTVFINNPQGSADSPGNQHSTGCTHCTIYCESHRRSGTPDRAVHGHISYRQVRPRIVWEFGDGGTSTAKNPSHMYQTSEDYTVTLTVTNAQRE